MPTIDVYALGMLANRCLGGNPPAAWDSIIAKATGRLPRYRFGSMEEMLDAIRNRG